MDGQCQAEFPGLGSPDDFCVRHNDTTSTCQVKDAHGILDACTVHTMQKIKPEVSTEWLVVP